MIDTQDKKDEVKEQSAETQEEMKKADAPDKGTSYKSEQKNAE